MEMCQYKIHKHRSFMGEEVKVQSISHLSLRIEKDQKEEKDERKPTPLFSFLLSTSLFLTTQDKNKNNNTLYSPFLKKQ